jgi:cellulose biosynthesis protein BcsQ
MLGKLFKKSSKATSRIPEDKEKSDNQIIGIWGSFGSGKTTLAIKLGQYLSEEADEKYNTIIVHDDILCPAIPTYVPNLKKQENKSIGKVLLGNIEQDKVKENLVTIEENNHIALLGYAKGENYLTYPEYVEEIVEDLLMQLRHLADYIIIDCSSYIKNNIFTNTVLKKGDKIITLSTADLKGLSYFNSTLPLLIDEKYDIKNHLNVVSNIKPFQAKETINDILGGKEIYLEYTDEIENQTTEKRLFDICERQVVFYSFR